MPRLSKQAYRDKAYDAVGDIQRYYRTHEVSGGSLYKDAKGYTLSKHNGETSACIWGAIIATGHGKLSEYQWRDSNVLIVRALEAALEEMDDTGFHTQVVGYNDGIIDGDMGKMRTWLKKTRALLKSGSIL